MKTFEKLNKNEMKMIVGGKLAGLEMISNGAGGGGDDRCTSSYFYIGTDGCGIVNCYTFNVDGSCNCKKTITASYPCTYA